MGDLGFRDLVQAYSEQIKGLAQGGADFILAETHFDLAEVRAVAVAAREVCDLPVGLSMTFESGACLTGTNPLSFVDTIQNMGVDLVATNCSAGPDQFVDVLKAMAPRLDTPLMVVPNAGLPVLENDTTVFRMGPEEFAEKAARLVEYGALIVGGCCRHRTRPHPGPWPTRCVACAPREPTPGTASAWCSHPAPARFLWALGCRW